MEKQIEFIKKYIPTFRVEKETFDKETCYYVYISDNLVKSCGNNISDYLSGMIDIILELKKDFWLLNKLFVSLQKENKLNYV